MRKQLLVLAGLVAASGLAFAAVPEGPKPGGPRGDRPRFERRNFKEALGLTDQQAAELKKLRGDQEKKRIKMQADMKIARLELRELLLASTVDEKAVRAKAKQVSDLEAAAASERVEAMLALRKVLSAEQAEKVMRMKHLRDRRLGPGHAGPRGPRPQRGPRQRGADAGAAGSEESSDL